MSNRVKMIAACGVGLAAGLVLGPVQSAMAGHANTLLEADLSGRSEVPAEGGKGNVGDRNGKGEAYVFGIDGQPDTLCYILIVEKVAELESVPGSGRAAHIHRGVEGTNGPVEVNLAWPQDGQAADCLTEGETGKGLDPGEVAEILGNPEGFYVNIHNNEYPAGAIRGQLQGAP